MHYLRWWWRRSLLKWLWWGTCYDCIQYVTEIDSSVTQDCAFRHRGSVTVTITVETSLMNKTAVSAW